MMSALSHNRPENLDFLLRQRCVPKSSKFSLAAAHSGAQFQFTVLQFQMYSMVKQFHLFFGKEWMDKGGTL